LISGTVAQETQPTRHDHELARSARQEVEERQLREVCENFLAATEKGDDFGVRTGLHDATVTLFDNDRRLLFATSFDQDWDTYIEEAIGIVGPGKWYGFLKFCEEIPEGREDNPPSADEVKALLEATRETACRYIRAYPHGTVGEIRKGLRVQKAFQQALDHPDAAAALAHPALKPLLEEAAD